MSSSAVTTFGKNYYVNRTVDGDSYPEQTKMVVGSGTTSASESDTSLETLEYEAQFTDANANLYKVASADGVYRANIEISGGVEVPAGTDIAELGIKTSNDDLVYREVRNVTTIRAGERISFEIEIEFINQ